MRVLVGGCLILAGLALGTHGLLRAATSSAEITAQIVSERVPDRPAAASQPPASPAPAISAVVTLPAKSQASSSPALLPAPAPARPPADGPSLVRELQNELRRVECYDGAINGIWTAPTREAMRTFLEQVNAKLPTDKPDHILLALLQGQSRPACGSCPAGQEASGAGRCLPDAVLAQAPLGAAAPPETALAPLVAEAKPPAITVERPRKTARRARREPPIEGRMGVGGGSIVPVLPGARDVKVAAAAPAPSSPPVAQAQKERRAARHGNRRVAMGFRSRAYLRPMRPMRYAFRPFRRSRGIAGLFGLF